MTEMIIQIKEWTGIDIDDLGLESGDSASVLRIVMVVIVSDESTGRTLVQKLNQRIEQSCPNPNREEDNNVSRTLWLLMK